MAKQEAFKDMDIRKLKQYRTPVGEAALCFLTEPSTEFNEDGVYVVKLKFKADDPKVVKMLQVIDEAADAAYQEVYDLAETPREKKAIIRATKSYKFEEDEDGNETGYVLVNFKRNATRKDRKTGSKSAIRLPMFNNVLTPINNEDIELWNGSELVVAFKLIPFSKSIGVGVSHRMEAVQVIRAVVGGAGGNGESYGLEAMDDEIEEEKEQEVRSGTKSDTPSMDTGEDTDY